MTNFARNFARFVAVPAVIGGAALGLAGMAAANPATPTTHNRACPDRPRLPVLPGPLRQPAPTQAPGWQNHHGPNHMN